MNETWINVSINIQGTRFDQVRRWKTQEKPKNEAKTTSHKKKVSPRFFVETRKMANKIVQTKVIGDCLQYKENSEPTFFYLEIEITKPHPLNEQPNKTEQRIPGHCQKRFNPTGCLIIKQYNHSRKKLLLSNDVESNPGPKLETKNKDNHIVCTYNLQGCKDHKKLKRVSNFFNKQSFTDNCVINLQETHISDKNMLQYFWKSGIVQSLTHANRGGVAILYSANFYDKVLETKNDEDGRMCSLTAVKNEKIYMYINLYAPNDHYAAIKFYDTLESWLFEATIRHPTVEVIISGDYNFIFDQKVDSIGRNNLAQEIKVAELVKRIMTKYSLIDAYRELHKWGGFTWGRNNPDYMRSRLDHILVSKTLRQDIVQSYTNKSPNESDHMLLYIELNMGEIKFGPGIKRCNADLLNNENNLLVTNAKLKDIINEIPDHWNPHQRLDYIKMKTREIILEIGRSNAKLKRNALHHINIEINNLTSKMEKLLVTAENVKSDSARFKDTIAQIDKLREALEITEEIARPEKEAFTKNLIFRSKAKWAEEGEKSNKYFFNLLKDRQAKMRIRKITANGKIFDTQNEVEKAITNFYRNLYKAKPDLNKVKDTNDSMFKDLPTLDDDDRDMLKKPLTKEELFNALQTCKESSPGPDGITYNVYKKLWPIYSDIILQAWDYSNKLGKLAPTQKDSVITLLEKKGKDKTIIENLRPISLSNCDIKICTKALAIRTNSVLGKILSPTQTGYVPGRQVNDNSRTLEEIIDYLRENHKKAYLITLDAQKAFDSVDHDYLQDILRLYGFPPEYRNWVKTIYTDLRANVMINGFLGNVIQIERSVKQGDALSCALFVISIDPLLRQINKETEIEPIVIENKKNRRNCKHKSLWLRR